MRSSMLLLAMAAMLSIGAAPPPATYGEADFDRVPKFDAHFHANVVDPAALEMARKDRFQILSINVDYPDFPPLPEQAAVARQMRATSPDRFAFATTFSMAGFGTPGWAARTIAQIDAAVAQGAVAVKVWKNIGMVAVDPAGERVFLDDPRFDPVMRHLEQRGIPLIAHQGEPRNCWLPLNKMTTENDRNYFRDHPQYHMYLHPEQPSYEALMAARDRFVARHPKLAFDGAHMGSLEWSVQELARFLDRYPNAVVDLAARMSNLQVQSNADGAAVRAFFIRYQDRLLYGTDLTDSGSSGHGPAQNPPATADFPAQADRTWRADWRYLATPLSQHVDAIKAETKGLNLPRGVIDKIYWTNARRFFRLSARSRPA